MPPKKSWLQPNIESEAARAQRKRVAKEQAPTLAGTIAKLDEELEKAKSKPDQAAPPEAAILTLAPPAPTIAAAPVGTPAPRTTPRLVRDDPTPVPVSERPTPVAVGDTETSKAQPDPHLVELAKLWPALTEVQRMQLVMFAKVMIHVGK